MRGGSRKKEQSMARHKSSNGAGVLVDTWYWTYKGVESELGKHLRGREAQEEGDDPLNEAPEQAPLLVKDQKVAIEVRLLKEFAQGDSVPASVKAVEFVAINKDLNLRVQGTDIEAIRVAVWSKLEAEFKIEWEPYLLIEIDREGRYYRGRSEGFSLTEITVYKGVARDGTVLLREYDSGRTSSIYKYRPWPGEYQTTNGKVVACIPATKANEESMENFRARINELRQRLEDMVKPDVILQTLANLSASNLLPAPSESSLKTIRDSSIDRE